MPKVSIIIPCYNVELYLRQCLDSVVAQTLKDIEIICVNDGSTDNTLDILNEYAQKDSRIIVINQENQGISIARGSAMKIAKGEYIQYVDSDDWISDDACELLYNNAIESNLDILSMMAINFNQEKGEFEDRGWYSLQWLPKDFKKIFSYEDCKEFITKISMASWLLFFRHDFLRENDIQWLPRKIFYEDTLFVTQALLKAKRISVLQECLYFRRWHSSSVMNNFDIYFGDWPIMSQMVLDFVDSTDSSLVSNYIEFFFKRTNSFYHKMSYPSQRKYLGSILNLYEYCIDYYKMIELPKENTKTLWKFLWLSPFRIIKLLMKQQFSCKINLPIFSLKKSKNVQSSKFVCKIFGLPILKIYQDVKPKTIRFSILGIPILKIKEKGSFRRLYLFSFIKIWKQNLFKKIETPGKERLILCLDGLEDKNAEAIDTLTFFEWLQKRNIPSRYIVLKDNMLVTKLKQQNSSFKDIIVVKDYQDFLSTCHDDICKSRFVITSFGFECDGFFKDIPYLKYIFTGHGVELLKESSISLYNEHRFADITAQTRLTVKMYQRKGSWLGKGLYVGLLRWDRLKRVAHPKKNIFIFFTWRKNIKKYAFALKNYQKHIFDFLTDPKLAELLKQYNIDLNISVHHALVRIDGNIIIPENVHFIKPTEISKVIGQTDLFITDYSSLVFDFMYLNIPTIFYRFDADYPYLSPNDKIDAESAKSHDSELYNVFYNKDEVLQKIEYYLAHNFELEPENYLKNKNIFWDIKDNCEALYSQLVNKYN